LTVPRLPEVLQQVTARYRAALLLNAGVLAGVSAGIVALTAWRLHALGWPLWRVAVLPGLLALAAAAALGWRIRRRWITGAATVPHLDRALGLQDRLTTAAEFAHRTPPPALYDVLLEDAARRFSAGQVTLPRPIDRPAIALAVILLLLWCWPGRGSLPMTLAQLPKTQPPPPPQPTPPPEQPQLEQQQQQPRDQQQQQQQGGQSQPQSGGQGQQDQQQRQDRSQSGKGQQQPQDQRGQSDSSQGGSQSRDQQPSGGQDQQSSSGQPQSAPRGQQDRPSSPSGDEQAKGAAAQQDAAAGSERDQSRSTKGSAQRAGAQPSPSDDQPTAPGGGQSALRGEATRADIQQLLKDVSNELKQLQAELAAANDQPAPEAGTSTDPELYGEAEALPSASGSAVPIRLGTDEAPTSADRPGGGVGRTAGEAATASPTIEAEDASLAEQPTEETAANRQSIPPEYRSVFEQLQQPKDAKP
jgi:hypothetical protein